MQFGWKIREVEEFFLCDIGKIRKSFLEINFVRCGESNSKRLIRVPFMISVLYLRHPHSTFCFVHLRRLCHRPFRGLSEHEVVKHRRINGGVAFFTLRMPARKGCMPLLCWAATGRKEIVHNPSLPDSPVSPSASSDERFHQTPKTEGPTSRKPGVLRQAHLERVSGFKASRQKAINGRQSQSKHAVWWPWRPSHRNSSLRSSGGEMRVGASQHLTTVHSPLAVAGSLARSVARAGANRGRVWKRSRSKTFYPGNASCCVCRTGRSDRIRALAGGLGAVSVRARPGLPYDIRLAGGLFGTDAADDGGF